MSSEKAMSFSETRREELLSIAMLIREKFQFKSAQHALSVIAIKSEIQKERDAIDRLRGEVTVKQNRIDNLFVDLEISLDSFSAAVKDEEQTNENS